MNYGIGLDIGMASVGYAIIGLNDSEDIKGIVRMGCRVFDKAEQPDTGKSLAAPRRTARGMRRRLRRHRHRLERIRGLITEYKLLTEQQLQDLFKGNLSDIYYLRTKALDEKATETEFARILIHLAQRRGFKSNRKSAEAGSKEDGLLLKAVSQNKQKISEHGYRTAGEMFYKSSDFSECKRNKGGEYQNTVGREMIADEATLLFETQRNFGCVYATKEFEQRYIDILIKQRSFDEGPGGESMYGGNIIERMVGFCTFEKEEKRAAKATYSFEYSTLLQKINNIVIQQETDKRFLTPQERKTLTELALKTVELNFERIRKALPNMPESATFNMVGYDKNKSKAETEKNTKFKYCNAYHEMRKALDKIKKGYITQLSIEQRDIIGKVFSLYKTEKNIKEQLEEYNFTSVEIEALLKMSGAPFKKFGHLSVKACQKIIPFLEQGLKYNEACEKAGYDFKGHSGNEKSLLLPSHTDEMDNITNPVVRRAISQSIKVVNAIIREMNQSPTYINIELAREIAKSKSERDKISKRSEENNKVNEQIKNTLVELGVINPQGIDIVKYRLWEEQGGICIYSLKPISIERVLFDSNYVEVDHIIPYSISFDDSRSNKVLVMTSENRNKGNLLPLEYLTGKVRDNFIVWVKNNIKQKQKKYNLLKETVTEDDEKEFRRRNLQDTQYISRFMYNFINDNLLFAKSSIEGHRYVTPLNGSVTAHLRSRFRISKVRADGDTHHAIDAVVIGCATQKLINEISRYYSNKKTKYIQHSDGVHSVDSETGEIFPAPWHNFKRDIEFRLGDNPGESLERLFNENKLPSYFELPEIDLSKTKPIFVSRAPRHKVTGAAHEATILSKTEFTDNVFSKKTPLTELKFDKNSEIAGYSEQAKNSDRLLYEALKQRLMEFGGDGKEAFSERFYKPKSDGTRGPIVKKVKITKKITSPVDVHGKTSVAKNETMVRDDVFYVPNEGYYFVPIYVADTIKPELPNKAVVQNKKWKEMDDVNFIFSLYPSDLIYIKPKKSLILKIENKKSSLPIEKKEKEMYMYYTSFDIGACKIEMINHDKSYNSRTGVKTLEKLEKYQVDILGNIFKVGKEKRMPFAK